MLCNWFEVPNNVVRLFIHILLTKAEYHVEEKSKLHELINDYVINLCWNAKSRVVSISENVVAGDYHHKEVKDSFPCAVFLNDELVQAGHVIPLFDDRVEVFDFSILGLVIYFGTQSRPPTTHIWLMITRTYFTWVAAPFLQGGVEIVFLFLKEIKSIKHALLME